MVFLFKKHNIENELKSINESDFQNLINEFLYWKGYIPCTADGSQVGKNKTTRGNPDSLFKNKDGKYVLCEYTTQQNGIEGKLKSDLKHCLKTSIPKSEIAEVILACNVKIKSDYEHKLNEELKKITGNNGTHIKLTIYNIQNLALELSKCSFSFEYFKNLNFEDIYSLNSFVEKGQKGMRPNFKNPFISIEKNEIKIVEEISKQILCKNKIAIYGNQGIGKTRLSIEVARELKEKHYYQIVFITRINNQIKTNIRTLLDYNEKFLIVFDNFDETSENLEEIINLLEEYEQKDIKIIFTLRNQFKTIFEKTLSNYKIEKIELTKMDDVTLKNLISSLLKENNLTATESFLEKIVNICDGNPSLGMMAILPIIKDDNYEYFQTPLKIYENYFNNYKNIDLYFDESLQKTFGAISFFGHVDKENTEVITFIKETLSITAEELSSNIKKLNKLEFVELNAEKNIVRISDTILSTYIFYKTYIEDKLLDLNLWLNYFMNNNFDRIYSNIVDITNTFGFEVVNSKIKEITKNLLETLEEKNEKLLYFYKMFYAFYDTKTLIFLKKYVDGLDYEEFDLNQNLQKAYHYHYYEYMELLSKLYLLDENISEKALLITIKYIKKQSSKFLDISKLVNDKFTFNRRSVDNKFKNQFFLIDFLKNFDTPKEQEIAEKLFLYYIKDTNFFWEEHIEQQIQNINITFIRFKIPHTKELSDLRTSAINEIFSLYGKYPEVHTLINEYCRSIVKGNEDLIKKEQILFSDFFNKQSKNNILTNIIYLNYCKSIKRMNIMPSNDLNSFKENNAVLNIINIYTTLNYEVENHKNEKEIKNLIISDLENKNIDYVKNILITLDNLTSTYSDSNYNIYVSLLMEILHEINKEMFYEIFNYYVEEQYTLGIDNLIKKILTNELIDPKILYSSLNIYPNEEKNNYKLIFFTFILEKNIDKEIFKEFIKFINSDKGVFDTHYFDSFLKYNPIFLENLDKIENRENESNIIQYLSKHLINSEKKHYIWWEFCCEFKEYFKNNTDLLKEFYISSWKISNEYKDYELNDLKILCDIDKEFIFEFLTNVYGNYGHYEHKDFEFIWEIYSLEEIDLIVNHFIKSHRNIAIPLCNSGKLQEEKYICHFILNKDIKLIRILFEEILIIYGEDKFIYYLKIFLEHRPSLDDFKIISFEKFNVITSYELKPKNDLKFLNRIKEMLENLRGLDYLEHIEYVEKLISFKEKEIEECENEKFKEEAVY
ncbi:MAG: ATP-binding protein [Methanobrevibacter sp.]|uniref:ATP-binding protein n=1 Tax=Methanobrevibacter sp. TaxID=66852 RepID=UPI0026DF3265|nr:ATP-binding protein [Methanobrevibacter sp.]MDO5848511.1 ATP-binding protein [Methanobrevibacter sp.]